MDPKTILVDTTSLLDDCITNISGTPDNPVGKLAIDLEGIELSRIGRMSLVQIIADKSDTIWVVDITVLGVLAFDHVDPEGRSLRHILESSATQKLFYDVRMDADALYHLYNIDLANVYDLQLLEVAARRSRGLHVRLVSGLKRTIDTYIHPPAEWLRVKDAGAALCFPNKGGSYAIFEQRPLDARILAYSAQDVALLFELGRVLEGTMGGVGQNWLAGVGRASDARVREAYGPYTGHSMHRAIAPVI